MKKALLLIAAIFAFNFANAQGFKFGLKGGANYSNVTGGDKEDFFGDPDYKTSYHFGVVGLYELDADGFLGIKPELLYTSKGYQLNNKFDNELGGKTDLEVKTNLNYISLPILLNINAGGLFFELGPEFAYLAAATGEVKVDKRDANGNKINDDKNEYQIDEDAFAGFDFGYVAGIGYQSDMGLGIGLRYNGGMKSIFDTKDSEEPNVKNSNFMLSLSYMFGGGN
ncbi:PorT family protein [Adhaeribacter sp. BT258]|uniref:PorT family protein n=1 Tax=Adhaeribacter terrigena TaxID=2793070 RepID=A0ABS1C1Z4_9BACT|nr:porin family protein [Adhaeribacter terrigena]MBK0403406.1 PorT family protein [Adhaeribacter terrigena]